MEKQTITTSTQRSPLFGVLSVVRHIKSGGLYVIALLPDLVKVESTAEPAYGYRALSSNGAVSGPLWVRSQTEMEDGRFELVSENNPDALGPGLDAILKPSVSRYEAEVVLPEGVSPAGPTRWDCTQYLTSAYSLSEFWEIVGDKNGSMLSDGLRRDPVAPSWLKRLDKPFSIQVHSISI
jgi:hypothetical protein